MQKRILSRLILLVIAALLVLVFFLFDLDRYFTLAALKTQQQAFADYYAEHTLLTLAVYFGIYVVVTALSLPGATVMTLAGGALFGLWTALVIVSFASSIGRITSYNVCYTKLLRSFRPAEVTGAPTGFPNWVTITCSTSFTV